MSSCGFEVIPRYAATDADLRLRIRARLNLRTFENAALDKRRMQLRQAVLRHGGKKMMLYVIEIPRRAVPS